MDTPKGAYLGFKKHQRGKAAVDVLPDVLATTLRSFSFPKTMHWDAYLEDGKGELLFGRPIRWILYLYGGRVVPFSIRRSELAESSTVQEIVSAAVTYGHRFLTTSGRAGRFPNRTCHWKRSQRWPWRWSSGRGRPVGTRLGLALV